ncbi:GNAT family N-acetyltransferase [Eisenbergiella tayi]|uniref:GNAT family N-acetyltransferase n=1 Tax=Eisenbergiella porci TaxID=2652274 RepID=A0A6N7WBK0_9FIRM|nr:GNAT family N-acetyltransferase [Eisenbergiella porci]
MRPRLFHDAGQRITAGIVYFYLPWRGQKSVELGYWLGKQYWGQGIATCAAKQLCDYAFCPWTSTVSVPASWKPIQAPGASWKSWKCAGKAGL